MNKVSEEYINTIVSKVATIINLTECQHSRIKFENIAQNYFGVLIPLALKGKKGDKEVNIDIVIKMAPTDERYRVSGALTHFFLREIYVYSTVLEKYSELQQSLSRDAQYVIPKCYHVCKEYCNEVIVMQNMCGDGYNPFIGNDFLDIEHIKVSIVSIAKFHAMSFILREKDRYTFEEAEKICVPLSNASNKRFMEILLDRLEKVLEKFENTQYVPLLEKFKNNYVELVEASSCSVNNTCICHGDIWKENILFKYQNNRPVSACIIDYQTVRVCSPAFDILFLIMTSTNAELRKKHYEELLNLYYQTFVQVLGEAGLDSTVLYSRQMFENDLKVVSSASFIIANTALWLSNGLQQEGHVRSKRVWTTDEEKHQAVNRYKNVIKGIIDDFISYGYLCL